MPSPTSEQPGLPCALITTDPAFRGTVRGVLENGRGIVLQAEIGTGLREIGPDQLQRLREVEPRLVFLDLAEDPSVGIRFAHFLSESNPQTRFIAAGSILAPELLMEAMRAGITEYLPKPVSAEDLGAALDRVQRKLGPSADGGARSLGKVYGVFSAKGGSGTTTVAANLAVQLRQITGKRTLLLDLDLELGEIAAFLGVQPRFNFVDLVRNFHRLDGDLLASYIEKDETGVDILSAPFHPEKPEAVTGEQIRTILQFLQRHYEYVVVDTSKSFSPATLATFEEADRIFLVSTVDLPSLRNLKRMLPLLDRITGSTQDRVRLVLNRFDPNDPITREEVERTLGLDVYHTLANDFAATSASINDGRPVVLEPRSRFAADLRELTARITGLAPADGKRSGGSLITRLFGKKERTNG